MVIQNHVLTRKKKQEAKIFMKKISLKDLNFKDFEKLSKDQLKNVLGGFDGSGSGEDGSYDGPPTGTCIATCGTEGGSSWEVTCHTYPNAGGCSAADNVGCAGFDSEGVQYFNAC